MLPAIMTQKIRYNAISPLAIIALLFSLVTVHCRPILHRSISNDHEDSWTTSGREPHALASSKVSPHIEMKGMLSDKKNNHVLNIR